MSFNTFCHWCIKAYTFCLRAFYTRITFYCEVRQAGTSAPDQQLLVVVFLLIVYPKTKEPTVLRVDADTVLGDITAINPHMHRSFRQNVI